MSPKPANLTCSRQAAFASCLSFFVSGADRGGWRREGPILLKLQAPNRPAGVRERSERRAVVSDPRTDPERALEALEHRMCQVSTPAHSRAFRAS